MVALAPVTIHYLCGVVGDDGNAWLVMADGHTGAISLTACRYTGMIGHV